MALDLLTLVFMLGVPGATGPVNQVPNQPLVSAVSTMTPDGLRAQESESALAVTGAAPDLSQLSIAVPLVPPVQEFIRFFQGRGRFIYAKWYARMARYEPLIQEVLARYDLPADLIYICMIESGFNPDAVSRASAVGPWQFMKPTGLEYGLRYDAWVDERRDFVKATDAAARHFRDLYRRFGTWPLAMAAYNAGVGAVSRAVKLMGTNDFWRLAALGALPTEATRYVPKAMAAMVVGHNPRRYGFGEVKRETPVPSAQVSIPGGTDLKAFAKQMRVSAKDILALNPELLRGYTPPYGERYPLRVPEAVHASVEASLSAKGTRTARVFLEHRVRFGETVRYLAKRYGVRSKTIRRDNRLGDRRLKPAEMLVIPKTGKPPSDPLGNALVVLQDPALEFAIKDRQLVYFPLQREMSLEEIASFFQVSPGHIIMWNGLDPDARLMRGMALRLYVARDFDRKTALLVDPGKTVKVQAGTDGALRALKYARKSRGAGIKLRVHTVRRGESLWKLARRYGVTVAQIRAENGLNAGQGLSPGTALKIPQHIAPRPRGKAARRAAKRGIRGRRYTVRRGDSLWKIARKFNVTVNALRKKNRFKRRPRLKPGQRIVIPL